jgi:riboflavin kinase/FMN adenylyltransferase
MEKKIFALGFFDGVHLGHQALLKACVELAARMDVETAAITFESHPQSLFLKQPPALLTVLEDRYKLLLQYGIDHVYAYPVTEKVMSTDWQAFLDELVGYGGVGFVCGHDFRFGHKGQGDAEKLRSYCQARELPCIIVPEQTLDGIRISSTHIRGLLEAGDMETAAKFLGHPHILSGEVVAGRQVGRTIGIPTANILIPAGVVVPKLGVYACRCRMGDRVYSAVTNIGSRPTVDGHQVRSESWILDFDGDLYGKTITLEFVAMLRPEEKFPSLEALQAQIHRDAQQARNILK